MSDPLPQYDASSLPSYSPPNADPPCWSASTSSRPPLFDDLGDGVDEYTYSSDHLHVSLGSRRWGTRYPVYGYQGVIEGKVKIRKRCSNAVTVTATLEGVVCLIATETKGAVGPSTTRILSRTVELYNAGSRKCAVLDGEEYFFTLPFPTYARGGSSPLPPAYTIVHYGASCDVKYNLRIDVVRRGLHIHERVTVPISYLPRSRPSAQPLLTLASRCYLEDIPDNDCVTTVELTTIRMTEAAASPSSSSSSLSSSEICSAHLRMPSPCQFAAGEWIPLAVTIPCQKHLRLREYLTKYKCLIVEFVRCSKVWLGSSWNVKESVLSSALLQRVVVSAEGFYVSHWVLRAGERQEQASFHLRGAFDISFVIRVCLKLPPDVPLKSLAWSYDQPVNIVTDPWIDPVLAEDTRDHPALGIDSRKEASSTGLY